MELPKDILQQLKDLALNCKTAEDLMAIAKRNGINITKEQAQTVLEKKDELIKSGMDAVKGMVGSKEGAAGMLNMLGKLGGDKK